LTRETENRGRSDRRRSIGVTRSILSARRTGAKRLEGGPVADVRDYELLKTEDQPTIPRSPDRPFWPWLAGAAVLFGIAVAVYLTAGRTRNAPPAAVAAVQRPGPPQASTRPLGAEGPAIDVPPLDQSDAVVRELVRQVTSHPRIAAWLATDGLIRAFTVAVDNVAGGATPAARFHVLRPASGFETVVRDGALRISPRSYQRYDDLADAMASIDAAGAARLYGTLKPRIDEAYRELGYPDTPFDRTLERAIVLLLGTPASDGAARLEPKGIGYGYADPALEGLTAAQKQLLRTGPRNVRLIQSSLRRIAIALGIPAERLPAQP
jgi:hypothetical protein